MDAPPALISCEVQTDLRRAKALTAAAQGALACLMRWDDCIRAAVTRPITFVLTISSGDDNVAEGTAVDIDGRVWIPIVVPTPLPERPGLARRLVLDAMLHAVIEAAAALGPQHIVQIWPTSHAGEPPELPDGPIDLTPGELMGLEPNEVLVIVRLDDDLDAAWEKYNRIDDDLMAIVDELPDAEMADTFANGNTRNWVITLAPEPPE